MVARSWPADSDRSSAASRVGLVELLELQEMDQVGVPGHELPEVGGVEMMRLTPVGRGAHEHRGPLQHRGDHLLVVEQVLDAGRDKAIVVGPVDLVEVADHVDLLNDHSAGPVSRNDLSRVLDHELIAVRVVVDLDVGYDIQDLPDQEAPAPPQTRIFSAVGHHRRAAGASGRTVDYGQNRPLSHSGQWSPGSVASRSPSFSHHPPDPIAPDRRATDVSRRGEDRGDREDLLAYRYEGDDSLSRA